MQSIQLIRVLLIDDDEDDYIITRDYLENGTHSNFEISWTPSPDEGLDLILAESFDVYLVDLYLGQTNGLELLEKGINAGCHKPIILLTGSGDRENDLKALELGAADYLVKGEFSADMLQRAILHAMRHRQSLEKERELGELKSRFVTMASHEFRTPLTTIMSTSSYLELAEGKITSEKRIARLNKIQNAAHNMTELINEVLSYGRGEANMLQFKPVWFDLLTFTQEIVEEISAASRPPAAINLHNNLTLEKIWADEKLLRQILTNLLNNGLKYSPENTPVEIVLKNNSTHYHIEVSDRGIGIPEKDQALIFDPFHRASNVYDIAGTGLGLAISKKAIEKHGGSISFSSSQSEGTTFHITLPIQTTED